MAKKKTKKIENDHPNPDTLGINLGHVAANCGLLAFSEQVGVRPRVRDYSIVITDPRGARKEGTDLSR